MQTSFRSRLFAALGVLLACSCWISAPALFGIAMGESFSEDPAEQARIAATREFWTTALFTAWLLGLVASSAIAGLNFRANRVLSLFTWLILLAFVITAVLWLRP